MNRKGAGTNAIVWIIVIALVAYLLNIGGLQTAISGGSTQAPTSGSSTPMNTGNCPSTGTTTVNLNTVDALATTATAVSAEYYIFDGNTLVKSGTTDSSGAASVTLTCGKQYNAIVLNTTTTSGAYAVPFTISALDAGPTAYNVPLKRFGNAIILSIQNPADPSRLANISIVAGGTKNFDITFAANLTARAYGNPIILCQANVSAIQSVTLSSFSDGTAVSSASIPKRISASTGNVYYAWSYPKFLDPSMGTIVAHGSITATASTPSTTDSMTCKIVDQAVFKKASYQTLGLDANFVSGGFVRAGENTETYADIGGPDSSTASLYFVNGGGY